MEDLKTKLAETYKAGEGYRKKSKWFQLEASTVKCNYQTSVNRNWKLRQDLEEKNPFWQNSSYASAELQGGELIICSLHAVSY